jgi:hypothetical protein
MFYAVAPKFLPLLSMVYFANLKMLPIFVGNSCSCSKIAARFVYLAAKKKRGGGSPRSSTPEACDQSMLSSPKAF